MTAPLDPVATLVALRAGGGAPFDPVRLHYLEALARRVPHYEGAVKDLLEDKLHHALTAYQARGAQHTPAANTGGGGHRTAPTPARHSALAELAQQLTRQAPQNAESAAASGNGQMGTQPELKSVSNFRATWSKLSVDRQLTQALAQAPENAGPLNSHQLVLRSLSVMREISPDYLNRFMSYVDALLWLDHVETMPPAASPAAGDAAKKRKATRPRAR